MNIPWRLILAGTFLVVSLALLTAFNISKPRILVLHSMSEEARWSQQLSLGIQDALSVNRLPVSVEWHYLREDTHPNVNEQLTATLEATRAINRFDPDVIIAIDDGANARVCSFFANQVRPRVIYVSIDQAPSKYGYQGSSNVTGIAELLPLPGILQAMDVINDSRPHRIAAIGIDNATGRAELKQVRDYNWGTSQLVASTVVSDFAAWKEFIAARSHDADTLLILTHAGLKRGPNEPGLTPGTDVAAWTETNAVPTPISLENGYVANGGGMSLSPAPRKFGQEAMKMALDCVDPSDGNVPPPMSTAEFFDVSLRLSALRKRGIHLPAIYEEAARLGGLQYP